MIDLTKAVAAFKAAWTLADSEGKAGHRTEAGMLAAAALVEAAVRESVFADLAAQARKLREAKGAEETQTAFALRLLRAEVLSDAAQSALKSA
jgi:hypothetical protein